MEKIEFLEEKAKEIRKSIIQEVYYAKSGHPGGSLSVADILTVLYFEEMRIDPQKPDWEDRDRFVLSNGHASSLLYSILFFINYYIMIVYKRCK